MSGVQKNQISGKHTAIQVRSAAPAVVIGGIDTSSGGTRMKRELFDVTYVLGITALLLAGAIFWGEVLGPVVTQTIEGVGK